MLAIININSRNGRNAVRYGLPHIADETGSRNGKKGTEEMRTNLKILRIKQGLNQKLFAEKIGVTRTYYGLIESGKVDGSVSFWKSLQTAFSVSDAEMWELMKNEA